MRAYPWVERHPSYDPGMSGRDDALAERVERDKRIRRRWKEITAEADTAQVERMIAHVEAQAEQLPASHKYR